jgi:malate permease and related proteins
LIELFQLFANNLLPIFLAAGSGYFLARIYPINPKTLSTVIFFIFSPCLVFNILTNSQLEKGGFSGIILLALGVTAGIGLLAWLIGRSLKLGRSMLSAVMLTSMFMNAGNYGLPVTLFAFGETALAYAGIFFVTTAILSYTAGTVIISTGNASLRTAFINLLKFPALYGLLFALLFIQTGWKMPVPLERTIKTLGDASIPTMLILLGVQFHSIRLKGNFVPITLASTLRLLVGPLLGLGIATLLGLKGAAFQAGVLETAMPTAVLTSALATQFETEAPFVSAVIIVTTILSIFTITPLLAYLGA